MRGIFKSNFFTMDSNMREELIQRFGVQNWEKKHVFSEVSDDMWWSRSKDGFYSVPHLSQVDCVRHIFQPLESDALALAEAVFPARKQHARVVDVCLVFLNAHAMALKTLCFFNCPPSDFAPKDEPGALKFTDEELVLAAVKFLSGELDDQFGAIEDDLRDVFPAWAAEFILELLEWKSPFNCGVQPGSTGASDSGPENGGVTTHG